MSTNGSFQRKKRKKLSNFRVERKVRGKKEERYHGSKMSKDIVKEQERGRERKKFLGVCDLTCERNEGQKRKVVVVESEEDESEEDESEEDAVNETTEEEWGEEMNPEEEDCDIYDELRNYFEVDKKIDDDDKKKDNEVIVVISEEKRFGNIKEYGIPYDYKKSIYALSTYYTIKEIKDNKFFPTKNYFEDPQRQVKIPNLYHFEEYTAYIVLHKYHDSINNRDKYYEN